MSQLPVTALSQRIAPSHRPGGQESVWQADVQPDYQHQTDSKGSKGVGSRRPRSEGPKALDDLVPKSERKGLNEDGIPRKLAWLAKHGRTTHTYEEILSALKPVPQVTRKKRRQTVSERKKPPHENVIIAHEAAQRSGCHLSTGPAMTLSPQSAYSSSPTWSPASSTLSYHAPETVYSTSSPHSTGWGSPHGSEVSMSRPQSAIPIQATYGDAQLSSLFWMDSSCQAHQTNPEFFLEAALEHDPSMMAVGLDELFTPEELVQYGLVEQAYQNYTGHQANSWQPPGASRFNGYPRAEYPQVGQVYYSGGFVAPEFPAYPSTEGGNSYNFTQYN